VSTETEVFLSYPILSYPQGSPIRGLYVKSPNERLRSVTQFNYSSASGMMPISPTQALCSQHRANPEVEVEVKAIRIPLTGGFLFEKQMKYM